MAKVYCDTEYIRVKGNFGMVDSVRLECTECEHKVTSFGQSDKSVRRCLALMREECPSGEENFYVVDDD